MTTENTQAKCEERVTPGYWRSHPCDKPAIASLTLYVCKRHQTMYRKRNERDAKRRADLDRKNKRWDLQGQHSNARDELLAAAREVGQSPRLAAAIAKLDAVNAELENLAG